MLNKLCKRLSHSLALLAVGTGLLLSLTIPVFAEDTMLLRTVELDVTDIPESSKMEQAIQTADETLAMLESTDSLLLHMETLRRAYGVYGQDTTETEKLLESLKNRYMAENENPAKYFDYGYAQLVFEANKNGLFFLRKANDKLATPYTSLAYGLAQIDADRIFEGADPSELTTRKMDVKYRLKDAIRYNLEDRLPGVWTSYVHILEKLADYPAYDDLRKEDVSTIVVPYGSLDFLYENSGNGFLALAPNTEATETPNLSEAKEISEDCSYISNQLDVSNLIKTTPADLDNDGVFDAIQFFKNGDNQPYQARVVNNKNEVIGEFTSHITGSVIEDLDGDGRREVVVRQFNADPYHPLKVYRWNGKCYVEDKEVTAFFN